MEEKRPKRQYPPVYEKLVPVALVLIGVAILILLGVVLATLLGLFPAWQVIWISPAH